MSISIYYWNCAAGLLRKIDYIRDLITGNKVDIFFVAEAEIKAEYDTSVLKIEGYDLIVSKTISSRKRSRLICYKRDSFKVVEMFDDRNEIIGLSKGGHLFIGLYRGFKVFDDETECSNWERILADLGKLDFDKKVTIIGDYNIDLSKENSRFQNELKEWSFSKGLSIQEAGITRARLVNNILQQSSLDYVLTNVERLKIEKEFNDLSDHCVLKARFDKSDQVKKIKTRVEITNWNFNIEEANAFLLNELRSQPNMFVNVQEADYQIGACLSKTFSKFVKRRTVMLRDKNEVTSPLIIKLKNYRDRLKKKWSKNKNAENWVNLVRASRCLRKEVDAVRKRRIKKQINMGSRNFWGEISNLMGSNKNSLDKLIVDNREISDRKTMANHFIHEFTDKVDKILGNYVPFDNLADDSAFEVFTIQDVSVALKRLTNKKSYGYDGLPCYFVKLFSSTLSSYLRDLFNLMIRHNTVPQTWKVARIIPVFKKGDASDPKNYRPVSNLNAIAKTFELCLLGRFEKLDFDTLMSPYQHGFRKQHSTETALCELISMISEGLDSKRKVAVYSADLTAAFDLLQKEKLVEILKIKGVDGYLINIMHEYLKDRFGFVQIDDERSVVKEIRAGCVQGSIVGPLLFNILMSELHQTVKPNRVVSYADDSYVVVYADTDEALKQKIQGSLLNHFEWLTRMGMTCNLGKTEIIKFNADKLSVKIGQTTLETSSTMKVLGVTIDEKLNWEPHIMKLIAKTRSLLFAFRYLRRHLSIADLKLAMNAHLISRLTYAAPVWSHSINYKLRLKLRSSYYQVLRVLIRDFEKRLSRNDLLDLFEMEDIVQVLNKRTSVFVFKLIQNLAPFKLAQRLMMRSYLNERNLEKVVFFDLSKTKNGKLCITNATKKIVDSWQFDWFHLSLITFKNKLGAQFQTR